MKRSQQQESDVEEVKRPKQDDFICEECCKSFTTMQKLIKHKLSHVLVITCDFCDTRFNDKCNLRRHMKKLHGVVSAKITNDKVCNICKKCFSTKSNMIRHKTKVHGQTKPTKPSTWSCRHCSESFGDYASLLHHVDDAHPLPGRKSNGPSTSTEGPSSFEHALQSGGQPSSSHEADAATADNPSSNESALESSVQHRYIYPHGHESRDLLTFLGNVRSQIRDYLFSRSRATRGIKWNLCVQVQMGREGGEDGEEAISQPFFRSQTYVFLSEETWNETNLNQALQKIFASMEKYMREGSGWYLKKVLKLEIHTVVYAPLTGSTFIPLPKSLSWSHSILNIRNQDQKCFAWCILASLHPISANPESVHHYFPYEHEINMSGIDFPVPLTHLNIFEAQNLDISVNVFTYEDKDILPLRITTHSERLHHVNLLLLKQGQKCHYCLIKDLDRFLSRTKTHVGRSYYCPYCLHGFIREQLRNDHLSYCSSHGAQKVVLPQKGQDDILEFKDFGKTLKVPFVIYADFETLNRKMASCVPDPSFSHTTPTTKLDVCGFGYKVVCTDPKYSKPTLVYRGSDASSKFIEHLRREEEEIMQILKQVTPMSMTAEQEEASKRANSCCLCKKLFSLYDGTNRQPVRHHDHVTGAFIGMAHNQCNLNCQQVEFVPVILHNLRNFDAHIICESLGKFKDAKLTCIAQNTERYVSFSLGGLRFIDSFQFLTSSLETLVEDLGKDGIDAFPHFSSEFPRNDRAKLLLRKGVYPYDYMDDEARFGETALPPREEFYSKIKKEHISDQDYAHAQNVFTTFQLQNMGEYHDLYLKTDVLLLCDVFEAFRGVCMDQYELDPCHFYTSPGLAWVACLKMTGVTLELMTDIDQILFVEAGIRGGISYIANRYARANNPLMKDQYKPSEPTSFLVYYDMNNLYGHAMVQNLAVGSFRFLNQGEIERFDVLSMPENGKNGYIVECSLKYGEHLHDSHNDYPLAPEKKHISNAELSPYAAKLWKKLHGKKDDDPLPPRAKVEKLMTTLEDKDKYVVHFRNLQLYLKLGMEIKQIHRVLEFRQEAWMKPYIDFNTEMRKNATSAFQKNFYKLMNVSVFGKTMENIRKHKNIELVHTRKRLAKLSAKPTYKTTKIFKEDLVAVEMERAKVKLYKPCYSGMCILDLSKLAMYDFFYNYLKKKYGANIQLQMTDTDSFLFHCQTNDIYADMKEDECLFDFSDYPKDNVLHSDRNKKVLGKMKDETNGKPISEFVGLRSKMYSFVCDDSESKRLKGIAKVAVQKDLRFNDYKSTLFQETQQQCQMSTIRSHSHQIFCETISKTGLSAFDDKRYLVNPVESYAYGHYKISQLNTSQ